MFVISLLVVKLFVSEGSHSGFAEDSGLKVTLCLLIESSRGSNDHIVLIFRANPSKKN